MAEGPLGGPRPLADSSIELRISLPTGTQIDVNELDAELKAPLRDSSPHITDVSSKESIAKPPSMVNLHKLIIELDTNPDIYERDVDNPITFSQFISLIEDIKQTILEQVDKSVSDDDIIIE